jgi:hypothetical protein
LVRRTFIFKDKALISNSSRFVTYRRENDLKKTGNLV